MLFILAEWFPDTFPPSSIIFSQVPPSRVRSQGKTHHLQRQGTV